MMNSGSLLALKDVGGWHSLKMVERYAHISPDHLRGEMAKTERTVLEAAPGTRRGVEAPSAAQVVDSTEERRGRATDS